MLHGEGGNHRNALNFMSPAKALAMRVGGHQLRPMTMVTVDGGRGYWNPHPGDDPFGMLVHELIPLCRRRGLGRATRGVGAMGISMGGYGALLLGEKKPGLIRAVAAISPAIWTSYDQARHANPEAYASESAFRWADVVRHTSGLAKTPVRMAIGYDDPFLPGVQAIEPTLPPRATVIVGPGCHSTPFFAQQLPASLAFLARYLN